MLLMIGFPSPSLTSDLQNSLSHWGSIYLLSISMSMAVESSIDLMVVHTN
jgi:hypothetical protein